MSDKRQSYEAGHRPKFMVVVDKSSECYRAVHFAARRTARTGASMIMLAVVDPPDNFEWLGVGEAMIEEAQEEARKLLDGAASEARNAAGVEPETAIRVGPRADEIIKLIREDEDISFLVLAAGTGKDGPGPLVTTLAGGKAASTFPVPIVIVPGSLTDEEIDALAG